MKTTTVLCGALFTICGALAAPAQAGWTYLPLPGDDGNYVATARACKYQVSSAYGPLWRATFNVARRGTFVETITATTYRFSGGNVSTVHSFSNSTWLNRSNASTTHAYASVFYDDRWQFTANSSVFNFRLFNFGGLIYSPSMIANC